MRIFYNKRGDSGFVFKTPIELTFFFSMFSFAMKYWYGTSNSEMNKVYAEVEKDTYQKIRTEDEMSHIHTCCKCNGFVDDRKDDYVHHECSEIEVWEHKVCPKYKEVQ